MSFGPSRNSPRMIRSNHRLSEDAQGHSRRRLCSSRTSREAGWATNYYYYKCESEILQMLSIKSSPTSISSGLTFLKISMSKSVQNFKKRIGEINAITGHVGHPLNIPILQGNFAKAILRYELLIRNGKMGDDPLEEVLLLY